MQTSILILGAAGRLGQCLTRTFAAAGWQVIAQARKPLPDELSKLANVRTLNCDALDRAALLKGAQGATVVINALNPPYTEWHQLLLPLADAAQATAKALGALLMLPGNVYNFGSELPSVLTPNTPERANTPKAGLRIEMEARMAAEPGLDSVVLRAGDFFGGPGTGSWFDLALASKLKSGRFIYPGPLDQTHAWAYLPDLAECFVRVAEKRSDLSGHHRLHYAGHSVEGRVMQQALEQAWGQPLKTGGLPWLAIRLGSPFVASWRAIAEMRYLWLRPHRLDDTELRLLIGEPPQTRLVTALQDSLVALGMPAAGVAAGSAGATAGATA
ncbi:NAD-dependent epimerase/dehydratase family protein [Paucibacter sp. TC2R-5]|uniref:NAD-dependent epimerase/dehydratase family protein n=1 Tax=Paucibacter sp. TC2R-5 TaxID=2893555 RepID=UPI0021E397AA|nr:NAD-dependent epimerase/dehydratase family protein [Paucibacter sp. TC2R-5]MCV2359438.1 NAD-dependent epimerase/dehydratase family protein [Paucibacter sp. TC2R-5]